LSGAAGGMGGSAGGTGGSNGWTGPWRRVSSKKLTSIRYLAMKANNPSGGVCSAAGSLRNPQEMSSSCSWCATPMTVIGFTSTQP
jgi:hypothetical protein